MTIRLAIVGFGKIARDQHVPAIAGEPGCSLVAVVSSSGDPGIGLPWFPSLADLVRGMPDGVDAVAICTPPGPRYAIARDALRAGLDVLLEKPPAATLGEIERLVAMAQESGRTLFAAWHSQHAPGVAPAAERLAGERIATLAISWREDVRKWHPGQEWIWAPGGFGVFDPGINALSIATRILPEPLFVKAATLFVPANKQAPIAAELSFGEGLRAVFDWRHDQSEEWTIRVTTQSGRQVELRDGGHRLLIDGVPVELPMQGEYPALYARFAALVAERRSEVDREPLRIVADAFMIGARQTVELFE